MWLLYQLRNGSSYLSLQRLPRAHANRHLIEGSCQNPWAASVIQHGHLGSRSPPSHFGTEGSRSPSDLFVCRLGMPWGALSGDLGPVVSWLASVTFSLVDLTPGWRVGLSWPHWVVLKSQSMADSNGYQLCMSPDMFFLTWDSLFLLSLVSIIKYPKSHI